MYDHQTYDDRVGMLLAHGKDRDDFCVVVSFYPIKENLLKDFSVKARINQSLDITLGQF